MRVIRTAGQLIVLVVAFSKVGAAAQEVPLVQAVMKGEAAAVQALLQQGVDVNLPALDGSTALHWAANRGDEWAVEMLIRAGANVKAANRHGVTPLSLASLKGNAAIISLLLNAGADANTILPEGETALMTAARTGRPDAVKVLLAHGASVNAKEQLRGQTALMWAAAQGHADAVRLLIGAGADIHARSRTAPSPPDRLGRTGAGAPGVEAVSRAGGDVPRGTSTTSATPTAANYPAAVNPELDERAETEKVEADTTAGGTAPKGLSAFLFAVRAGHIETAAALLDGGASVHETMSDGTAALSVAIINGHYSLAKLLLERGADPNAAGQGWTPLHQVLLTRRPSLFRPTPFPIPDKEITDFDLMTLLIDRGANVNALTTKAPRDGIRSVGKKTGATPFFLAAKGADVDAMRFLVSKGADPLLPNEEKTTPLMVAAGVGIWRIGESPGTNEEALEAVKYAYELGGEVNSIDVNGETAVHGAAHRGAPAIIQFLADKGANLDVANKIGWTPLTIAGGVYYPNLYENYPEAEAMLTKLGAKAPGVRRPIDAQPQQEGAPVAEPAKRKPIEKN
jgi:ankyrin repeat protein